jgi:polar amino acid transport system substrate-binding protein
MRKAHVVTVALAILLSGCTSIQTAPTEQERQALAPTGKLRAGVIVTNPIHATKEASSGELKGVAIDLGREMARRIGVPFEVVAYTSAGVLVGSAKSGQWDIVFVGIPVGERHMDLSPPYAQVEMGYLVPKGSSISRISEVDRPGIRIAVQEKGASDLLLTRTIKQATLVRRPTNAEAVEALGSGQADALAGIKTYLIPASERLPGSRVLEGRIAVEGITIGVPKGHNLSAAYVRRFVDAAKSEGLVKAAIERAGVRGLDAAP